MKNWMIWGAAALMLGAAMLGLQGCAKGEDASMPAGWLTSLDEGLAEAKSSGKLVMVDFAAVW